MAKGTILITGGAGGIGISCAYALKDYQLIITDFKAEIVNKTVEQLKEKGVNAVGIDCDITNENSIARLVDFTRQQGELRAIVHTAGVSGTVNNTKLVFDVDLLATYHLIRAFKPLLGKNSVMVLFSSMMGHAVPPNAAYDHALRNPYEPNSFATIEPFLQGSADTMYNFAKRGVLLLTKDFAFEFGQQGARIVSVSPGVIMTPMAEKALVEHPQVMEQTLKMTPINRYGQPEDIANAVKFLVSDDASFITGTDLLIDGGVVTQMVK